MSDTKFKINDVVCMATYNYPNSSLNKIGIVTEYIGFIREVQKDLYKVSFIYFNDFKKDRDSIEHEAYYVYDDEIYLIKRGK